MHIQSLLESMVARGASDLYITINSAPAYRIGHTLFREGESLQAADIAALLSSALTHSQLEEFSKTFELNTAITHQNERFRVNVFRQQLQVGMVIHHILSVIPTVEALRLPQVYNDLAMQPRGLVLIAGPTGSGKTTSLAAMIGHRNTHGKGHIITVEDPVEFTHRHAGCIITQRDVGLDTISFSAALKNALRQRPDVVAIGEIRDREVMEQVMYFAETGHLCIATIHASTSAQAIERVVNLFPERKHMHVRHQLASHMLAILAQRLVPTINEGLAVAYEVLMNKGLVRQLIEEGKTEAINDMIAKGAADGMVAMDTTLLSLYQKGLITQETAIAEAENPAHLRMQIRQAAPHASSNIANTYTIKQADF